MPAKLKKEVYKRANRKCKSCGKPLKMADKKVQIYHAFLKIKKIIIKTIVERLHQVLHCLVKGKVGPRSFLIIKTFKE